MSTTINVEVLSNLVSVDALNKAAIVFTEAVLSDSTSTDKQFIINSVTELKGTFKGDTDGARIELAHAEYLLKRGVALVVIKSSGTDLNADISSFVEDNDDNLHAKFITAPYLFKDTVVIPGEEEGDPEIIKETFDSLTAISEAIKDSGIEFYITIPNKATGVDIDELKTAIGNNRPDVELFLGEGVLTTASSYDTESLEIGISASVAAIARKIEYLKAGTPWIPVAGEDTGVFPDFKDVKTRISRKTKENYQKKNINPLITKIGVGVHLVAQNTLADTAKKTNPMIRSHVVTLTNYLKRIFLNKGDAIHQRPNNSKTWDLFQIETEKLLTNIKNRDGIEQFKVITGLSLISEEDIAEGRFKAIIRFLPIRVIEEVVINLVVQETVEITVNGGNE